MSHSEFLKPSEKLHSSENNPSTPFEFTAKDVGALVASQAQRLEALRPHISRKLQFALEEKLKLQKQELERLLGLDKNLTASRSRYSNVLDTQYFEQIFL